MESDNLNFLVNSEQELDAIAEALLKWSGEKRVFAFYGEMGAGKTTFIKAICKKLGVRDAMSSPTFSIINEYLSDEGKVFHFDFYRLKHEEEAFEIGVEEYFYGGSYCFIEWPEKISNLVPQPCIRVHIDNQHEKRVISCTYE